MNKRKLVIAIIAVIVMVPFLAWFFNVENNSLELVTFELHFKKLPDKFGNYRIVQITDLHNKEFGPNQRDLVAMVKSARPDLIVVTGDLIDRKRYGKGPSLSLLTQLKRLAPVYFVTGNHEWWSGRFDELSQDIKNAGVTILQNRHVEITRGGESLYLVGIDDIAKQYGINHDDPFAEDHFIGGELNEAMAGLSSNDFKILLAHRPERFPVYALHGVDLVFAGHAHGGQVRPPFSGAIVTPDQGFFPNYSDGVYRQASSTMVLSRGLGVSTIPFRLFCLPEVIVVVLKK
ncbi:MAG: metallophosphoesterase [Candidatus Aquicultor sp.]